jgi:hypothetical protein
MISESLSSSDLAARRFNARRRCIAAQRATCTIARASRFKARLRIVLLHIHASPINDGPAQHNTRLDAHRAECLEITGIGMVSRGHNNNRVDNDPATGALVYVFGEL